MQVNTYPVDKVRFDYPAYYKACNKYENELDRYNFIRSNVKSFFITQGKTISDSDEPIRPIDPPTPTRFFVKCESDESNISINFDRRIVFIEEDRVLILAIVNELLGNKITETFLYYINTIVCNALLNIPRIREQVVNIEFL